MRIVLLSMMRLGSKRAPRKMIADIGYQTLAERAISILEGVNDSDVEIRVAVAPKEEELSDIVESTGVEVILRTMNSVQGTEPEEIFDSFFKEQLEDFDWAIIVKSTMPFLNPATVSMAVDKIKSGHLKPFHTVFVNHGQVWDEFGDMLVGNPTRFHGTFTSKFYTNCDAIHAFPVSYLGSSILMVPTSMMQVPRGPEFMDVSNVDHLKIAQAWAAFMEDRRNESSGT